MAHPMAAVRYSLDGQIAHVFPEAFQVAGKKRLILLPPDDQGGDLDLQHLVGQVQDAFNPFLITFRSGRIKGRDPVKIQAAGQGPGRDQASMYFNRISSVISHLLPKWETACMSPA